MVDPGHAPQLTKPRPGRSVILVYAWDQGGSKDDLRAVSVDSRGAQASPGNGAPVGAGYLWLIHPSRTGQLLRIWPGRSTQPQFSLWVAGPRTARTGTRALILCPDRGNPRRRTAWARGGLKPPGSVIGRAGFPVSSGGRRRPPRQARPIPAKGRRAACRHGRARS